MGVMPCYRKGCDEIMCHTYVDGEVGYICRECQNEFKEYATENDLDVSTEGQIKMELTKFMSLEKGSFAKGKEMDIDEFFDQYTR